MIIDYINFQEFVSEKRKTYLFIKFCINDKKKNQTFALSSHFDLSISWETKRKILRLPEGVEIERAFPFLPCWGLHFLQELHILLSSVFTSFLRVPLLLLILEVSLLFRFVFSLSLSDVENSGRIGAQYDRQTKLRVLERGCSYLLVLYQRFPSFSPPPILLDRFYFFNMKLFFYYFT